jgi:TolB-like protein/Flp pilus assembly protein TadD
MPHPEPERSGEGSKCVEKDLVQAELDRVLHNSRFAGSQRLSQFLRFIVEKTLAGHSDDIKEYSIAVEVYGRRASHDARHDAIVRVEANRLRAKLREYYQTDGKEAPVQITVPKGTYAPVFVTPSAEPADHPLPSPAVSAEPATPVDGRRTSWVWAIAGGAVVLALSAGLLIRGWPGHVAQPTSPQRISAVAVLPFVNLAESETAAFCDGLTEDLTTALARVPGIGVPARTTMSQYAGRALDVRNLGKQLGVDALLEGSVRRTGERFRVTAQLINVADGYHLWAETYDRANGDPLALERELSDTISTELRDRISGQGAWRSAGRNSSAAGNSTLLEAHQLLASPSARDVSWPGRVPPTLERSIELFEKATTVDPAYARAWVGLAQALEFAADFDPKRTADLERRSQMAADRALVLDNTLAEAHAVRGSILLYRTWDFREAERSLARAVELNPREPRVMQEYSDLLRLTSRGDLSRLEVERALLLDPRSAQLNLQRALLFYDERKYSEAIRQAEHARSLRAEYTSAPWLVGLCHERQHRYAEAEKAYRQALAIAPEDGRALPALGYVLAVSGRAREAHVVLAKLKDLYGRGKPVRFSIALVLNGLGQREEALRWLEEAYEKRDGSVPYLSVEPRFDSIRHEPRFTTLVRKLGLVKPG